MAATKRLHLTLKTEAARPAVANLRQQQARFDTFVHQYNHDRPHQALDMATPGGLADGASGGHNDHMPSTLVGARELKVRLGSYLRRVQQGQTLVVTDRGRPVAELRPMPKGNRDAVLARLEAVGVVTRPTKRGLAPFPPIALEKGASLSDAVLEDREDRF